MAFALVHDVADVQGCTYHEGTASVQPFATESEVMLAYQAACETALRDEWEVQSYTVYGAGGTVCQQTVFYYGHAAHGVRDGVAWTDS